MDETEITALLAILEFLESGEASPEVMQATEEKYPDRPWSDPVWREQTLKLGYSVAAKLLEQNAGS